MIKRSPILGEYGAEASSIARASSLKIGIFTSTTECSLALQRYRSHLVVANSVLKSDPVVVYTPSSFKDGKSCLHIQKKKKKSKYYCMFTM